MLHLILEFRQLLDYSLPLSSLRFVLGLCDCSVDIVDRTSLLISLGLTYEPEDSLPQ